jgi:membrane fusion protein (multidrug efflux system)
MPAPHPLRVVIAASFVTLLAACGGAKGPPAAPTPTVGVVTVNPQDVPLRRQLVGRLSAYRSADVRARVAGVLKARVYQEGDDVKAGQVLFRIDPAPLNAATAVASAAQAQAQANYTNAHVAAERARSLAPQKYISKADLDNALAAERAAAAALQQTRAGVQEARINLGYATVTAPISGRAGRQQVTEGALVGQGDATLLTTVDQIDPLYINFSIAAADYERLRKARDAAGGAGGVQVTLPDGTPYPQPGRLDYTGSTVDPATGAITLRAVLANPDHLLLPGMFVNLDAKLGLQQGVYRVPQAAVQRDPQGAFVLAVAGGKVERRNITLDRADGDAWIVSSGLSPGAQVIVSGVQQVIPGGEARAEPWTPPAAATPAAR